jgi:hypothetical protein
MTQIQRNVLMKSLYVNEFDRNIINVLECPHAKIRDQNIQLQDKKFSFNNEDVRCKFSVVYTNFRITHPELYGYIDKSSLNEFHYYYMFNKFDDKEDSYYLKFIYNPVGNIYGYIEMSPLTNNYQYYEGGIDKRIRLDFTKGREFNVATVNNWYKMLPSNQKLKIEWGRVMLMVMCFEISYGRYLKDSTAMFKEADKNKTVLKNSYAHYRNRR